MRMVITLAAVALTLSACMNPRMNEPGYRAAYDACDFESQKAVAGNMSVADRVAIRVDLNRQCMALKGYGS